MRRVYWNDSFGILEETGNNKSYATFLMKEFT